jgi:molybdenum cofactor cytidylyltransferase
MMITAIVLAAGIGRRMGQQKLLLPLGELTLIEHVVKQVMQGGVDGCIVVTGWDHDRIKPLIENLGARTVVNPHALEGGMLSSVRCGLAHANPAATGYLVCLGDLPGISNVLIKRMLKKIQNDQPDILSPVYESKRGHPLYFQAGFRDEVMERYDDVGLKGLLDAHKRLVTEFECSNEDILIDLDTPADYENWMKRQA